MVRHFKWRHINVIAEASPDNSGYKDMTNKLVTALEESGVLVDNFISAYPGTGENSAAAKMLDSQMQSGTARATVVLGYCPFQRSVLKRASEMGALHGWAWILAHGQGLFCHTPNDGDDAMVSVLNNTIITEYL
jgi:hypothetical protein